MKLITKQMLLDGLISLWEEQYKGVFFRLSNGRTPQQTVNELKAARPLTVESAERILGNNSWTTIKCYECGQNVEQAVDLKEEIVCYECIAKAYLLFQHREKGDYKVVFMGLEDIAYWNGEYWTFVNSLMKYFDQSFDKIGDKI